MSREPDSIQTARDLKRSALAVAMVLLKELDDAVPEAHGARAVAALMLRERGSASAASVGRDASETEIDAVLLAITGAVGRLLDAADGKCPEGSLKAMLLFKIVEDLANEGYELENVLDFVRHAHAGETLNEEASAAPMRTESRDRRLRWAS